ncbi:MAG: hypothetical protein VB859_17370 [Planctomycetaceae bacterium]
MKHALLALALVLLTNRSAILVAQTNKPRRAVSKTEVRVELITDRRGAPLAAQRWARIFQRFRVPLRVRRELGSERTSVEEQTTGSLRRVMVIGRLERSGRILVPGKTFSPANSTALGKWLEGLRTFGARGDPKGQPSFGLSQGQFQELFETLAQPVKADLSGKPLSEAIRSLQIPSSYSLQLGPITDKTTAKVPPRTNGHGLSRGSTLAAILSAAGLAFHPRRTPTGRVELVIGARAAATRSWPLGWPLRLTRLKTAPSLFKIVPVNLDKSPLLEVIDAIAVKTEVPMLIDHHAIGTTRLKLNSLTVTVPAKKTSWFQLQKTITNPHHLTRDLRIDESGKPFVLVTVIQPKRARLD